jgi:hypothetical protein
MGAIGSMLNAVWKSLRIAAMLASGALQTAGMPERAAASQQIEALWIGGGGADHEAGGEVRGLLTAPPAWTSGDAAAVVIGDAPGSEPARLVDALLADDAAVLELDPRPPGRRPPDGGVAASAPLRPQDLQPRLFDALLALRRDYGAGLVVAIGFGPVGEAVLSGGDEAAAHRLGDTGPRFAALAFLGPGQPRFVAGATPPPDENWPARAGPLCAILASAVAAPPGAERGPAHDVKRSCLSALLPDRSGQSTARAADDAH